jgi:hypothetical protein
MNPGLLSVRHDRVVYAIFFGIHEPVGKAAEVMPPPG